MQNKYYMILKCILKVKHCIYSFLSLLVAIYILGILIILENSHNEIFRVVCFKNKFYKKFALVRFLILPLLGRNDVS